MAGVVTALEAQASVDIADRKGHTALNLAARHDDSMLCALLGVFNANVGLCDENDVAPIAYAKKKGFTEVCGVLEDFGALKARDNKALNKTLMRAVYYGNRDAVVRLLDKSAEVSKTRTPLG